VFGATFLALTAAGAWCARHVQSIARVTTTASPIRYPDPSWYLAFDGGPQLDDYVLYYGLGPSIAHARAADMLILGNSRVQFAFPDDALRTFEATHGVTIFSLGFGYVEGYSLPLDIIRKFDLRPKLVLVNVDDFFVDHESEFARVVRSSGRWGAVKTLWGANASARLLPVFTRVFPSFVTRYDDAYLLRSSTTGAWLPVGWPHADVPYARTTFRGGIQRYLPPALRFRDEMRRRGTAIVLTCVPAADEWCASTFVWVLAARLGCSFVLPRVSGLTLGDRSHLSTASAQRFAAAALGELERTREFRAIARR